MRAPTQFKDNQLVKMLSYPETGMPGFTWIDIPKFQAQMIIKGMERGRSAARFSVKDVSTGIEYPVFMSDMLTLVTTTDVIKGYTDLLYWEVCKRGENYGLRVAKV